MLEKNNVYIGTVEDFGYSGEGVIKNDGIPVFIPYALKNEKIEYKVVKVLKDYAFGRVEKIIEASPDRVTPLCGVFKRCGGCQMLHISYEKQLEIKKKRVEDCMKKYANADIMVNPVVGMEHPFEYRNKAQYPVNGEQCGFYAPRSHDIIAMDKCLAQDSLDEQIIKVVMDYKKRFNAPIRNIYTRHGDNECMVVVVTYQKNLPEYETLVNMLKNVSEKIVSVIQNINTEKTNVILGKKNKLLFGKEKINASIGNIKFEVSPLSFFQVNRLQTKVLYDTAKKLANFKKTDNIADLYCGIGSIGLYMADSVNSVTSVEIVPQAIEDAKINAKINNISNINFICGESETVMPKLDKTFDAVILDPPRKGCEQSLLECLDNLKIPKILYISCNPSTLARDIKLLSQNYSPSPITPVDMFPHTEHVETVVLLSRKRPDDKIEIDLDLDEVDITSAESKATYDEIKAYVLEKYNLKVSNLYISQIKRKRSLEVGKNYNLPKSENSTVPTCPPEKETVITEALRHFGMIK